MAVEVTVCLEERKVPLDIDPNDLNALKAEFDEWCGDDEAMKERRKANAPVFSMFNPNLNCKVEVKRKYAFREGDRVYVSWSPLKLQQVMCSCPVTREMLVCLNSKWPSVDRIWFAKLKNEPIALNIRCLEYFFSSCSMFIIKVLLIFI